MDFTIRKTKLFSKEYSNVKNLLKSAFPKAEQMPMLNLWLLTKRKGIECNAFYDDNIFCGFLYTCVFNDIVFVLYLAVNPDIRSNGLGSKMLKRLKTEYPDKTIALNVETPDKSAPNISQRLKRIAFYEKNGIMLTDYIFEDEGVTYSIMADSENFSLKDYVSAMKRSINTEYKPVLQKS